MHPTPSKSYTDDLHRLDVMLRELKVKYDQFFAGALDRQPLELRAQVERTIRRLGEEAPAKYALRFHYNTLVSRFNSFSELWGKTLRTQEEGDHRAPSVAERFGLRQHLLTRCMVSNPEREEGELRRLHTRFVEARARHGQGAVPYEKFVRGIAAQTRQLRAKHECGQIEVRLVEAGDEVQIRARPGR